MGYPCPFGGCNLTVTNNSGFPERYSSGAPFTERIGGPGRGVVTTWLLG